MKKGPYISSYKSKELFTANKELIVTPSTILQKKKKTPLKETSSIIKPQKKL